MDGTMDGMCEAVCEADHESVCDGGGAFVKAGQNTQSKFHTHSPKGKRKCTMPATKLITGRKCLFVAKNSGACHN